MPRVAAMPMRAVIAVAYGRAVHNAGRWPPEWGGRPRGRGGRPRKWGGWPRERGDRPARGPALGLAVLAGLIQVFGTRIAADTASLPTGAYVLLLAGPVALTARRAAPAGAYLVAAAATVAYAVSTYPRGPYFVAALLALLAAARTERRGAAWAITVLAYLATVLAAPVLGDVGGMTLRRYGLGQAIALAGWTLLAMLLAEANRVRSEQFAQMARVRAEQARAKAEQAKRQASEERLRIARELHDVIGHHLSLINVQAGVGLHLMDAQPEQARAALSAIKQASAEALREVRSVLGALRPEDEAAPRAPAPSVARLAELLADVEAAGLRVESRVDGEPRPVPSEVDRAAYRIVQEALTNVRRHAGPGAAATVTIGYTDGALTVTVDDDGVGASEVPPDEDERSGAGIAGMRERAAALGGSLAAGPGPAGGFRVVATLPLSTDSEDGS